MAVPRTVPEDLRRKDQVVRWDHRLGVDPLLARRLAGVDLDPGQAVHLEEGSRQRRRHRDSDREDRAGRVIGLVRYCPVAVACTAAIHEDCTAGVAAPNPAADVLRMEVPALAAAAAVVPAIPPAGLPVVHPVPPEVARPHSGRNCSGNDAAGDAAAADGTEGGNLVLGFDPGVAVAGRRRRRVACTAGVVGGSGGSSSRVCRRPGSGRTGQACWGRGGSGDIADAASAVGRTASGDAAAGASDAAGAVGDGGACRGRRLCCWRPRDLGLGPDVRKIRTDAFRVAPGPVHLPASAAADEMKVVHRMPAKIHRFHCHRPLEISLPFPHPLLRNHFENSFHRNEYQYHFANYYSSCLSVVDDDGGGVRHLLLNDDR